MPQAPYTFPKQDSKEVLHYPLDHFLFHSKGKFPKISALINLPLWIKKLTFEVFP